MIHLLETDSELAVYTPAFGVLNAADYGVPQNRHRGIVVAVRDHDGDLPWPPPPLTGPDSPDECPYVTVREAIGDLPSRTKGTEPYFTEDGQHLHFGRRPMPKSLERYKAIPPWWEPIRPDAEPTRHHSCLLGQQTDRHHRCHGPALVGSPLGNYPYRVLQT